MISPRSGQRIINRRSMNIPSIQMGMNGGGSDNVVQKSHSRRLRKDETIQWSEVKLGDDPTE